MISSKSKRKEEEDDWSERKTAKWDRMKLYGWGWKEKKDRNEKRETERKTLKTLQLEKNRRMKKYVDTNLQRGIKISTETMRKEINLKYLRRKGIK